jgi:hypothetical protein
MPVPKIAIERMLPEMYVWQIFSDTEVIDEEYGDHTIEECLTNAIAEVPAFINSVEIIYCGFHMGMISTADIRLSAAITAEQILWLHSARTHTC